MHTHTTRQACRIHVVIYALSTPESVCRAYQVVLLRDVCVCVCVSVSTTPSSSQTDAGLVCCALHTNVLWTTLHARDSSVAGLP